MGILGRWKRWLYTLCFAALSVLDFVRNTQNGDVWGVAVNLTGLVMLVVIASAWPLKRLLTVGNGVWTLACIALAVYARVSILPTGMDVFHGMYVWTFVSAVANAWWIGIFLKDLVKKIWVEKSLAFRPGRLGGVWILLTVLMVCSLSQRIWPLWFLAMFGIFYLTPYTEEESRALADGLIDGTILGFFGLQIFAYGCRPYDVIRYVGAYTNCNMAALHYLTVYAAVLLKLHMLQKRSASGWRKLLYLVGACGMLGFLFMTMGRTSWGIAVLLTVVYGFLVMRRSWGLRWRQILVRGAALTLGTVLLFPAVFGTVRWLPTILHHPIWFLDEYSPNKVHSFDPADSWKYTEMDEFLEAALGRIWGTFRTGSVQNPLVLTAEAAQPQIELAPAERSGERQAPEPSMEPKENKTEEHEPEDNKSEENESEEIELVGNMDTALGARLSIYRAYFRDLNLLGHGPAEGMYQFKDWDYHAWHAQNLWLEVAYRYGIPAGILFAAVTVWLLVSHTRRLKLCPDSARAAIPLLMCLVFFGYGTMECVWNTGQYILVLFFLVQHPLFYRERK